jgi:hypothetical protein
MEAWLWAREEEDRGKGRLWGEGRRNNTNNVCTYEKKKFI